MDASGQYDRIELLGKCLCLRFRNYSLWLDLHAWKLFTLLCIWLSKLYSGMPIIESRLRGHDSFRGNIYRNHSIGLCLGRNRPN